MPTLRTSRSLGARDEEAAGSGWFDLLERWDPVGVILTAHGLALFFLDEVVNPPLALVLILALAVWRLSGCQKGQECGR